MKILVLLFFALSVLGQVSSIGVGEVSIEPTEAQVYITIREVAQDASKASKASSKKANEIVPWLKSIGGKDIKTTSISLNPQFNYDSGKQRQIGYESVYSLAVTTSLDKVGDLIDGAISKGANGINGLSFTATKEVLAKAKGEAIKLATENALSQIDSALSGIGKTRGQVIGVKVLSELAPFPRPMMMEAMAVRGTAQAPIEGGSLTISASVEVTIGF